MSGENLRMRAELYLATRLKAHGVDIMAGTTDFAIVKERIKRAILEHGLADAIIGKRPGSDKAENYAQVYHRLYAEELQ
jgi:hypothetical protein